MREALLGNATYVTVGGALTNYVGPAEACIFAALAALPRDEEGEGPQPIRPPVGVTCTGCKHLETKRWREYMYEDDEYDSGTSADCKAIEGGKNITAYWLKNSSPPSWCPLPRTTTPSEGGGDA